ncbi:MAG: tRNA (N6-isopentenyl adenosine(37)-C2)-methylthiotransferase MiaB [Clostridia bacterium]|nr:tRNA (N6-isopentenyl adenosine(37)-C2)-methylthiotransferase MiaB [Clostridia bacterium]
MNYIEKLIDISEGLTYSVKTYGCQMNVNDSMKIMAVMNECGFHYTESVYESNIAIINTCCVRENAENKVHGLVGNIKKLKESGRNKALIVLGCMMQQEGYAEEFMSRYSQVDAALGTSDSAKLPETIYKILTNSERAADLSSATKEIDENARPFRHYRISEFVTIMTGCNNFCTYCVVPYVRGRERSREPKDIIYEINELTAHGTREIVLLGQNVNSYGKGFDEKLDFSDLIQKISDETDVKRIRYMTSHPKDLSPKLIDTIAENPLVCKHIHLPVQSGSTKILKQMNRGYTKDDYLKLCDNLKSKVGDIILSTDIIVGFPGETDEDFKDTLDVVSRVQYGSAFMFKYSIRTGTKAASMADQVDEDIKSDRLQQLLTLQEKYTKKTAERYLDKTVEVLVESTHTEHRNVVGKTSQNLSVALESECQVQAGDLLNVKINEIKTHTLIGKII